MKLNFKKGRMTVMTAIGLDFIFLLVYDIIFGGTITSYVKAVKFRKICKGENIVIWYKNSEKSVSGPYSVTTEKWVPSGFSEYKTIETPMGAVTVPHEVGVWTTFTAKVKSIECDSFFYIVNYNSGEVLKAFRKVGRIEVGAEPFIDKKREIIQDEADKLRLEAENIETLFRCLPDEVYFCNKNTLYKIDKKKGEIEDLGCGCGTHLESKTQWFYEKHKEKTLPPIEYFDIDMSYCEKNEENEKNNEYLKDKCSGIDNSIKKDE